MFCVTGGGGKWRGDRGVESRKIEVGNIGESSEVDRW